MEALLSTVYAVATSELYEPYFPKVPNDIILNGFLDKALWDSALLKVLQMRIGHLWEMIATECFGWIKVTGIDLICPHRKIALELKNTDNTDNSSSKWRNINKLLEFRNFHPDYQLYYLGINNRNTKDGQCYCDASGIVFPTGEHALKVLFGDCAHEVVNVIRSVITKVIKKK